MDRLLEILALLENPDQIPDEELAELESELMDLFDGLRAEDVTDEVIEALGQVADACDTVRGIASERITLAEQQAAEEAAAQAARDAALEELEQRVHTEASDTEPEGEPEGEPDGEEEGEPEGEPEVEGDPESEPEPEGDPEPEGEPVGAAAASTTKTPMAKLAKTRPQKFAARPRKKERAPVRIMSRGTGHEFDSKVELEDELLSRYDATSGIVPDPRFSGKMHIGQFQFSYPDNLRLPEGRVTDVNDLVQEIRRAALSQDVSHMQSLMADGGICVTPTPIYDLQTISGAQRPLRASVTTINAPRGGVTFDSPILLEDILVDGGATSGAIGSMTEAQDAAGATNKTYQTMPCGTPVTVEVDIIWRQLGFGVLTARTNPERVSQFTDLTMARFARYTEQRLWTKMLAGTKRSLNAPQQLGAVRDFLTAMNRAAINFRSIHRMPATATLDLRAPRWIGDGLFPDDQIRALMSYEEQYTFTIADVERWLAARNIRVAAWYEDDWTTAAADEGGVNNYPATFKVILTHPGYYGVVDNGTLDLGLFRDGTMVNDNVFRTFAEEFWNLASWGVDAWDIEFSLCANGASAGSVEPTCGS